MNTKALRQKILDLAIHGKLVPQDPNDEPASVLLERIRAEKERLVKEGKIKRPKKTKATSDKPHYPYELPEGWCWCNLNEIAESSLGKTLDKSKNTGKVYPYLCALNVKWNAFDLSVVKSIKLEDNEKERYQVLKGDLLICEGGDVGRSAIWNSNEPIYFQNALHRVRFFGNIVADFYLYLFWCYKNYNWIDDICNGVTIKHLTQDKINALHLPLPPVAEQQRIVIEVKKWFVLIDQIEQIENNLQSTIKQTKSKILDLAIHGKLVPQDPTDEPASELLKRINPKAEITCDNGHYQKLPEGWCECKLSDVCVFDNGYAFSSDNYYDCGIPLIRISNITNTGSIDLSSCVFIQDVPSNKFIVKSGDLLIAMSGATTGKMGVYLYEEDALLNQRVGNLKCTDAMLQQYRNYYMFAKSDYILKIAYGGAQPNISAKAILDIDVMLPPLNEQHRIVAKIEEIFAQLDAIETSL